MTSTDREVPTRFVRCKRDVSRDAKSSSSVLYRAIPQELVHCIITEAPVSLDFRNKGDAEAEDGVRHFSGADVESGARATNGIKINLRGKSVRACVCT